MSRPGDDEGFRPHPGDPWHPDWSEGDDATDETPAISDGRPRRRGIFGRRRKRATEGRSAPSVRPPTFAPHDDWAAPSPLDRSGGRAFEDWRAPETDAPAWTDDGIGSAEFESAFTVGGAPAVDEGVPEAPESPPEAGSQDAGSQDAGSQDAEGAVDGSAEPGDLARVAEDAIAALSGEEEPAADVTGGAEEAVELTVLDGGSAELEEEATKGDSPDAEPLGELEPIAEPVLEPVEEQVAEEIEPEPEIIEPAAEAAVELGSQVEELAQVGEVAEPEVEEVEEVEEPVVRDLEESAAREVFLEAEEAPVVEPEEQALEVLSALGEEEGDLDDWTAFATGELTEVIEDQAAGPADEWVEERAVEERAEEAPPGEPAPKRRSWRRRREPEAEWPQEVVLEEPVVEGEPVADEWVEELGADEAEGWAPEPVGEVVEELPEEASLPEEVAPKRRWWRRRRDVPVAPLPGEELLSGEVVADREDEASWEEQPLGEDAVDWADEVLGAAYGEAGLAETEPIMEPPAEPLVPDGAVPEETEDVVEEALDWAGDPSAVPRSWFTDVDEDEVDVPPLEPADVEWPASAPDQVADASGAGAPAPDSGDSGETLELFRLDLPDVAEGKGAATRSAALDAPLAPPAPEDWEDRVGDLVAEAGEPLEPVGTEPEASGGGSPAEPAPSAEAGPQPGDDWFIDDEDEWSEEIYVGAVTTEHLDLAEAIDAAGTEERELQAISAPMAGLDSGVVGFEDVEDLGSDEEYVEPKRSDLGLRIVTGLVLVGFLFGSLWASGAALAVFIGVIIMIGLIEYYTTLRTRGFQPVALFGYLGGAGALVAAWFHGPIAIPAAVFLTAVVVFFFYAFAPRRRDALTNGGLTVLGVAWITGTAAFAMPIVGAEDYRTLVIALVVATVAMDVGAYAFGRAWGSAPLAPVLSPNKSIEGLAGGVVLAIGAALVVGSLAEPALDIRAGAALGLVVAVMAPLGDLAESMLKRSLGVKDMGTILPGHGGILDRVDAFLFVLPAVWVLYTTLGYLG